jgi:replication-associated recombination protein RarA
MVPQHFAEISLSDTLKVRVIGSGLIGTSIGLALKQAGCSLEMMDIDQKAQQLAKEYSHLPIPLALRNAPTKLMKELNYGKEYQYAHNFEGNFASMEFLPPELKGTQIYSPSQNAKENDIRAHLRNNWKSKYGY